MVSMIFMLLQKSLLTQRAAILVYSGSFTLDAYPHDNIDNEDIQNMSFNILIMVDGGT